VYEKGVEDFLEFARQNGVGIKCIIHFFLPS